MKNLPRLMLSVASILLISFTATNVVNAQELDKEQKAKVKRISSLVDKAGDYYKDKDFKSSAKSIKSAQRVMLSLAKSGDETVLKAIKNDYDRLAKARGLLEKKGQKFSDLPPYESLKKSSEGSGSKGSGNKDMDSDAVSFVNHVAPIFVEYCGKCHIERSQGRYSVATYEDSKKGTRKGITVKPRDIEKSRLIALVENGTMPPKRENNPVPPEKVQILKDWIEQGAKFDGPSKDKKAHLKEYVSIEGSGSKGSGSKGSDSKNSQRSATRGAGPG